MQAEYLHRLNRAWALFGSGDVGMSRGGLLDWSATAGVRGEW